MYNFISFDYVHTCEAISKFNLINLSITPKASLCVALCIPFFPLPFPPREPLINFLSI